MMDPKNRGYSKTAQVGIIIGAVLIFFGIVNLIERLFGSSWWHMIQSFFSTLFSFVAPIALIGIGIVIVWAAKTGKFKSISFDSSKPLRRSIVDKRIGGVCGGIATFLNADSALVRILVVILFVLSPGLVFFIYLIAMLIIPKG